MADKPWVMFLMGPTASGKTDLAVELVRRFPMDIVSVDSALVYREMDIGTAKPDASVQVEAPHRLIDILDPAQVYSAARFRGDALKEIEEITGHGRIPLLVGGTMLYFRVLEQGLSPLPAADEATRREILDKARRLGWKAMHSRLAELDPESAARIHPNDPQRIQRALEIHHLTGLTRSELWARECPKLPFRVLPLLIAPQQRSVLHERIAARFDMMLAQGFVAEVARLRERADLSPVSPSMRAVGYRQVWDYLSGQIDAAGMRHRGIVATRQLAKRQLTWMRSRESATWLDSMDRQLLDRVVVALRESGAAPEGI